MRRKDWADEEAERIFDMVRDCVPDDDIIEELGKSLRKAARDKHGSPVTGETGEYPVAARPRPRSKPLLV